MLATGTRLGTYEVLEQLDAGGMGVVFRARDHRLDRDVALKVLPERFKLDPHRLARFSREARVLASLNHPNITTLHAIEALDDTYALVLELVGGETLADRIARGPIPTAEALGLAVQIAAALEAAHEHGIVHRDLKPDNIKLRTDGTVKVLDFGLAKMIDPALEGSDPKAGTVTAIGIGPAGAVMGTPAYMSPEQARGLAVDNRTDVWAFACVLYETLTGRVAFAAPTVSDTVAAVLDREPDWSALPPDCPAAVRRLLRRCLVKDRNDRLRHIGDAAISLKEAQLLSPAGTAIADDTPVTTRVRPRVWPRAAMFAAIAASVAVALVGLAVRPDPAEPTEIAGPAAALPVVRFAFSARPLVRHSDGQAFAVSPDGTRFAYHSDQGLVVRSLDRLDTTLLPGLGAFAMAPFFSPDGAWIGYGHDATLKKVPTAGGSPVTIADVAPAPMGSWTDEGIVFADVRGLFRVSVDGGTPEALLTDLGLYEQAAHPQLLPGGHAIIFTVVPTKTNTLGAMASMPGARVEVLSLVSRERRTILRGGGGAQYLPSGHLVYAAGNELYAVAFDVDRLDVRGDPVAVVTATGPVDFAVSDAGTLVYTPRLTMDGRTLVWVDRQGREEPLEAPAAAYTYPRLSPDGTRLALDVFGPPDRDIWIWDLHRKVLERFTLDPAGNALVAWSPDGRYLAFGSDRFGVSNLFRQLADRSDEPERLLESERMHQPLSFTPDGRLLFSAEVPGASRDIHALSLDGTYRVEPVIEGPGSDLTAEVSPDGRWIAYDSNESGQFEVYVRPYPNTYGGGRLQISSGGGRQPLWSPDGRELFYRDLAGAVMAAPVSLDPTFVAGAAVKLFGNAGYRGGGSTASARTYDVSPDDGRFLLIKEAETHSDDATQSIVVVLNWFEELKRLVPVR